MSALGRRLGAAAGARAGVALADKQAATKLLHACGATIDEMNCVRKHLSRVKGGRLAEAVVARGASLFSLIVSDVIGDPLDVIASGPPLLTQPPSPTPWPCWIALGLARVPLLPSSATWSAARQVLCPRPRNNCLPG